MRVKLEFIVICCILFLGTIEAHHVFGAVIDGKVSGGSSFDKGGEFEKEIPPIGLVGNDNHQDHNLHAFDELQNIVLSKSINVDILESTNSQGILPQGITISSHYVFYDPESPNTIQGCVQFDSVVVALITDSSYLLESDFLKIPSATYLNVDLRGLESVEDSVKINNPNEVCIDLRGYSPGDYFRVISQISPTVELQSNLDQTTIVKSADNEETSVTSSSVIPDWIRNNAKWWSDGSIADSDFISGIEYLIKENIISISDLPVQTSEMETEQVPEWVRNNAAWWADGLISDTKFVSGIKYLVEHGLIIV